MRKFFHPSHMVVFGVAANSRNLAKNIISNSLEMGFKGEIHPVGREPGNVHGLKIITDPRSLPEGIDLAVILVPAKFVAETLGVCGQKGIRHAIISTGGFRELDDQDNPAEKDMVNIAKRYGIRFIGPNCIGVICTGSGLCTPFNPMRAGKFKKGSVGMIVQSGGVTTQCAYYFSEEHLGFSKIISMGNKLDLNETDFLNYLIHDEDTEQIHMYLESIEDGRALTRLARTSKKPIVIFKSNVGKTAKKVAYSHTAALSNDDRIVDCAMKQAGIVRVEDIHHMTVAAKALQLPPLRGNRLAVISLSGGFSVILGDACERYGFKCPPLPRKLMDQIEGFRRAGVIRMSNPMDFGDVHDIKALAFTLERCLALDDIDGVVLSFMYEPEMVRMFGGGIGSPEQMLNFVGKMCKEKNKPIALSFFAERQYIEAFKQLNTFPVFSDPVESVRGLRLLRDYWQKKTPLKNKAQSKIMEKQDHFLEHFFSPESVAMVGATNNEFKMNFRVMQNLLNFQGQVYPVNPNANEILGIKAFASLRDIPDKIDLVVSAVPASKTMGIVKDCDAIGARHLVIIAGGFSEGGAEGQKLHDRMSAFTKEKGIRVLGPNTLSPVNTANHLAISFNPIKEMRPGGLSFAFQSGFYEPKINWILSRMGINKMLDMGNKMDINEVDALTYFSGDENTKVIAMHIESLRGNINDFFALLKSVSQKKPTIILKSGRTPAGSKAAASHTGSIALENDLIFDGMIKQTCAIRAQNLEEFFDLAKSFEFLTLPKGKQLAIITLSGGEGVMATDSCGMNGLGLASLSRDTHYKLKEIYPPWEIPLNPFDAGVCMEFHLSDLIPFFQALTAIPHDENVDCTIMQMPPSLFSAFLENPNLPENMMETMREQFVQWLVSVKEYGKPFAMWCSTMDSQEMELVEMLEARSLPVFQSSERAIKTFSAMYRYGQKSGQVQKAKESIYRSLTHLVGCYAWRWRKYGKQTKTDGPTS